jgi:hypothetical protein
MAAARAALSDEAFGTNSITNVNDVNAPAIIAPVS